MLSNLHYKEIHTAQVHLKVQASKLEDVPVLHVLLHNKLMNLQKLQAYILTVFRRLEMHKDFKLLTKSNLSHKRPTIWRISSKELRRMVRNSMVLKTQLDILKNMQMIRLSLFKALD